MPITNFEFPGVTLRQTFAETPASTERTLAVAIVGSIYKTHSASNESPVEDAYNPAAGTTFSLPGFENGSTVIDPDTKTQHLVVKDGVFSYCSVSKNEGSVDIKKNEDSSIEFTGVTFTDDQFHQRGVIAGDPIVIKSATSEGSDSYTLTEVISVSGDNKVYIASSVLSKITGAISTVYFCEYADASFDVGGTTFSINATAGTVEIKPTLGDSAADSGLKIKLADLNGAQGILLGGKFYIEYREKVKAYNGKLGSVGTVTDIVNTFGYPNKDNPVALACYAAVLAGNNAVTYFTGVDAETAVAYSTALDFLDNFDNIYSIVPASTDVDVIKACVASCIATSDNEESTVRRALWYGIDTDTKSTTTADKVSNLIVQKRARSASERAVCVWADGLYINGELVPNFVGAAAAAGMRAYEPCHRPLSNLGYSFLTVSESGGFTYTQLKELGKNGIWVIANNADGLPVNKRQVTTAASDNINKDEESIIANADTVALSMCRVGKNLVGCSNITPELITYLGFDLDILLKSYTINRTGSVYIGPQLLAYDIVRIYQDTVNLDHVYADVEITPPKPFNRFHMTLRVI